MKGIDRLGPAEELGDGDLLGAWARMSRMRAVTSGGATVQPTRSPVAAKALEMPSTKMV